jgi:hypothetical protein
MSGPATSGKISRDIRAIVAVLIKFSRSILAIFVGFVAVLVLTIATDVVLHAVHFYPPLGEYNPGSILIWATIYRTIYGIIGSYVTARLAPRRPMKHALIGGAIGFVLATIEAAATWNHVPSLGSHWYASPSSSAPSPPHGSAPNSTFGKPAPANPLKSLRLMPHHPFECLLILFYLTSIYVYARLFYVFRRSIRNFRPHFCLPRALSAKGRQKAPPNLSTLANPFLFTIIRFAPPVYPESFILGATPFF